MKANMGQLAQICALVPQYGRRYPGCRLKIKNIEFNKDRITYDYLVDGKVIMHDIELYVQEFIDMLRRWVE